VRTVRLTVSPEEAGERLDRWLAARVEGLSRGLARRVLQEGGVFLGERRTRIASLRLRAGQEVTVSIPSPRLLELRWSAPAVVHRDEILLVADKPPGQPVQPTREGDYGSLETALAQGLRGEGVVARALHRLDAGTSGLVAFTLEPASAREDPPGLAAARKELRRLFREHLVERTYLAVAEDPGPGWGDAEERLLEFSLERRGTGVRVVAAGAGAAREARTLVRLERRGIGPRGTLALLVIRPRTGRLHQIRAHLAAAGVRLLGERRYLPAGPGADEGAGFPRPALHAWRLEIAHPLAGALRLEAPPPADLAALLGEPG